MQGDPSSTKIAKSSEKKLLTFDFKSAVNPGIPQDIIGTINESNKTITIVFPPAIAVNNLIASFTILPKASANV